MRTAIFLLLATALPLTCFSQNATPQVPFETLFPLNLQRSLGLQKLTPVERQRLHLHTEAMLLQILIQKQNPGPPVAANADSRGKYLRTNEEHSLKKNIDRGAMLVLNDGSLWQVYSFDKFNATLWLPLSRIRVVESMDGLPGYDYLIVNTDDGEKVRAKFLGKRD